MKVLCIGIALLALLAGCSGVPAEVKTRYVVISPSPNNLRDAHIESPPDPVAYAGLETYAQKEEALTRLITALYSSLGEVNKRLAAIRQSVTDARAIYKGESAQP